MEAIETYKRQCPVCSKDIFYTREGKCKESEKRKTKCNSCRVKRANKKVRPVRIKKQPQNWYWDGKTIDAAILRYQLSTDVFERNQIYEDVLRAPFEKMVEYIVNRFKFQYVETGSLDLMKECLVHVVLGIKSFDGNKGKSFGYFSIIAKHFCMQLNNANFKRWKTCEPLENENNKNDVQPKDDNYSIALHNQANGLKEVKAFIPFLCDRLKAHVENMNRPKGKLIANRIIELMSQGFDINENAPTLITGRKVLCDAVRAKVDCTSNQILSITKHMEPWYKKALQEFYGNSELE